MLMMQLGPGWLTEAGGLVGEAMLMILHLLHLHLGSSWLRRLGGRHRCVICGRHS